jgi:uncharacterized protein
MDPIKIDVTIIARDLKLAPQNVEAAITLLDGGNTIPFITRFRKDQTDGLNENQLLAIKQKVAQLRALAERKATILRAIEGQAGATAELRKKIESTASSRRLEDLYLPFKTKKQTRASVARQQGLVPLADEIFNSTTAEVDFAGRATDFVRVDKGLNSVDDVIKGVGDLIVERFSENETLRSSLRKLYRETATLSSTLIERKQPDAAADGPSLEGQSTQEQSTQEQPQAKDSSAGQTPVAVVEVAKPEVKDACANVNAAATQEPTGEPSTDAVPDSAAPDATPQTIQPDGPATADSAENEASAAPVEPAVEVAKDAKDAAAPAAGIASPEADSLGQVQGKLDSNSTAEADAGKPKKKKKRKKKKKKQADPFQEFDGFEHSLSKLPHHRVLAINRGERSGRVKIKLKIDQAKATEIAVKELVPEGHPSADFLSKCVGDLLTGSLLPSIEREVRRDITEQAERHAVEVFANNLKNLLLQPPIRNRTILAIDPGYKRGCSVALIDNCGNLIESGQVFIVGNQTRRDESKERIRDWVKTHSVDVIAIGNGAACREVEQMVSDSIAEFLQDEEVQYAVVNEAGASVYSTSETGREDFPDLSPAIRSAVSIGRRLQDPLSELVKIAPANIGVGMYQHDVKAKHLSESLDDVVQFCVNQVGVDLNTAGQALLKYVSGLNALTARRVVEYRAEHGRFGSRDELKNVTGFGDATFVQSAGFLRIHGGQNPLDATGIHPESYDIATDVLKRVDAKVEEIFPRWLMQPASKEVAQKVAAGISDSTGLDQAAEVSVSAESTTPTETTDASESMPASDAAGLPTAEQAATNENATEEKATEEKAVEKTTGVIANLVSQDGQTPDSEGDVDDAKTVDRRQFDQRRKDVIKKLTELDLAQIAQAHSSGVLAVKDIVMTFKRPAWDPRDKVKKPIFRRGILKADDLKPEMQLDAQVVNVVDFGVFVDIGLGESSLVHVSRLSSHYIADPHKVFAVGDAMKVWVVEVSSEQRRVKLTAIRPGTKKPGRRSRPTRSKPQGESKETGQRPTGRRSSASPDHAKRGARRPGKFDGGRGGSGGGNRRDSGYFKKDKRKAKPKPVKPITDKMLTGDEPMRSFSDLAQFVKRKPEPEKKENGDAGGQAEE